MSTDRKKPEELSEDELISLALSRKGPVDMGKLTEASKFIYDLQIKNGDTPVPLTVIYYTYKLWKGFDNKKQNRNQFFRDFGKYFTQYRGTGGRYYLLNPEPFDMSEEMYWESRNDLKREQSRSPKRKQHGKKDPA